jgi:Fe2+ or Zn2+ uptake regulation protein
MSATAETVGVAVELDRELTERLREGGHRVTSQRLLVHRAVCEQQRHLTAEQVLGSVSQALPSISLPTIYATLELLEDLGLVRRVSTGTGALLFESRRTPHAHAACRRCGQIVDVPAPQIDPGAFAGARAAGFAPEEAQLIVFGLCNACRAAG